MVQQIYAKILPESMNSSGQKTSKGNGWATVQATPSGYKVDLDFPRPGSYKIVLRQIGEWSPVEGVAPKFTMRASTPAPTNEDWAPFIAKVKEAHRRKMWERNEIERADSVMRWMATL